MQRARESETHTKTGRRRSKEKQKETGLCRRRNSLIVLTPVSPREAALRRFGKFPRQSTRYLTFPDNCFLRPTTPHFFAQETFLGYRLGRLCRNETLSSRDRDSNVCPVVGSNYIVRIYLTAVSFRAASCSPLSSSIIADCERESGIIGAKRGSNTPSKGDLSI